MRCIGSVAIGFVDVAFRWELYGTRLNSSGKISE
jgi:hypothetical protein